MNNLLGLNIQPDGWKKFSWETLQQADDYSDDSFAGCQYRLPTERADYAVNVAITGRKSHDIGSYDHPWYKTRVKIEYVGDGEPSVFDGGWIFSPDPLTGDGS